MSKNIIYIFFFQQKYSPSTRQSNPKSTVRKRPTYQHEPSASESFAYDQTRSGWKPLHGLQTSHYKSNKPKFENQQYRTKKKAPILSKSLVEMIEFTTSSPQHVPVIASDYNEYYFNSNPTMETIEQSTKGIIVKKPSAYEDFDESESSYDTSNQSAYENIEISKLPNYKYHEKYHNKYNIQETTPSYARPTKHNFYNNDEPISTYNNDGVSSYKNHDFYNKDTKFHYQNQDYQSNYDTKTSYDNNKPYLPASNNNIPYNSNDYNKYLNMANAYHNNRIKPVKKPSKYPFNLFNSNKSGKTKKKQSKDSVFAAQSQNNIFASKPEEEELPTYEVHENVHDFYFPKPNIFYGIAPSIPFVTPISNDTTTDEDYEEVTTTTKRPRFKKVKKHRKVPVIKIEKEESDDY